MMKKLAALALATLLVLALIPMNVAARTLTQEEKDLIEYLREASAILDDGTKDIAGSLAQGENYIASLSTPLTTQQIALIRAEVEKAVEAVQKEQSGNAGDWSEETRNEILDRIDGAAGVLGGSASANAQGTLTVKDQNGQTIVVATGGNSTIRPTGFDASATLIGALVVMTLLSASAYASKKAGLI